MDDNRVYAAGGVLWRDGEGGVEVAVVHRPRYDDWSFPKGKRAPGEDDLATALREVREETGFDAEVGPPLGAIHYEHLGRPKVVRYWALQAVRGAFTASDEVDRLEWVSTAKATRRLTYGRDQELLRRFLVSGAVSAPR